MVDLMTAVTALQQGEQWWLLDCNCEVDSLDPDSLHLMQSVIIPEQERTCAIMLATRRALTFSEVLA